MPGASREETENRAPQAKGLATNVGGTPGRDRKPSILGTGAGRQCRGRELSLAEFSLTQLDRV